MRSLGRRMGAPPQDCLGMNEPEGFGAYAPACTSNLMIAGTGAYYRVEFLLTKMLN